MGDLTNGTGASTSGLAYTGSGILQVTPTNASNYTGGLTQNGTGTLRVIVNSGVTTPFGAATNVISLIQSGALDIRTDGNLSVANPVTANTNNVAINVDQATSGNLSKTVTFNGASTCSGRHGQGPDPDQRQQLRDDLHERFQRHRYGLGHHEQCLGHGQPRRDQLYQAPRAP